MKALRQLVEGVLLRLPGRKIFFIYTHRNGYDRFGQGLKANTEISYWSFRALAKAFPRVHFLRLQEEKAEKIARIAPQDVVIGHIGETFLRASERTRNMVAFYPWCGHEERSTLQEFNCLPKEQELRNLERAASVILLTSEFNQATYLEKPANFWYDIFLHKPPRIVHQPIDLTLFTRIKTTYTTSDFLYIGNDAYMKGLDQARALVAQTDRRFHIYGIGGKRFNHLNVDQVALLPGQADFFLQPGKWEGQCVAILEAAARGFIPIVTPETGYPYSHPFLLRYGDAEYNTKILQQLLLTTPQERKELGDFLYEKLAQDQAHASWETLTRVLVEEVGKF